VTNATQIVVIGIFIFFLVVAVIVFAAFGTSSTNKQAATVEIWGTLPTSVFSNIVNTLNSAQPGTLNMVYKEIDPATFEGILVNAIADGEGPDAVLLPSDLLVKQQRKLALVSFEAYSERDFKDSFIQGSEILLTTKGTYGLPFLVDPLVMYWNRDILNAAAIAVAPTSWEQMLSLSEKLTKRDEANVIKQATLPFGDYANVDHAKDIITTLMMQSGSRLTGRDNNGNVKNLTADNAGYSTNPVQTALDFYTQFADPLKPVYTWNRSFVSSKDAFLNGDLAFYFGPASEYKELQSKNPNLNFDVAAYPQPKLATVKKTGATIYSFSVLASSRNQSAAFGTIAVLTSAEVEKMANITTGLPPARRDLLSVPQSGAVGDVFWRSALWGATWLDPDPIKTDRIFNEAVGSIVTGRQKVDEASKTLGAQIDEILRNLVIVN